MKALDDTKIIDLFFERDETAIRYASEKYGNRLRSLSHSIVKDRQTAEECENDTYMEAWDTIPPHKPRSYLYSFLARIIRRSFAAEMSFGSILRRRVTPYERK